MSVPKSKRKKSGLELFYKANELACYTIKICSNKNVFEEKYQNALTNKVIDTSVQIFVDLWTANNIKVCDKKSYDARIDLERRAKRNCNNLLAMMQIAQRLFHLSTKRIKFWGNKTLEVRNGINKLAESDINRYRHLFYK